MKNHHKRNKLDQRWRPYYTIIQKTGPVSYRLKDQLTGSITKAHAEQLRAANIDNWKLPTVNRPLRKAALAAPVSSEESCQEQKQEDEDGSQTELEAMEWMEELLKDEPDLTDMAKGSQEDIRKWTEPYQRSESGDEATFICSDSDEDMSADDNNSGEVSGRKPKRSRSDNSSGDLEAKRRRHLREDSENESDIPIMERKINLQQDSQSEVRGTSTKEEIFTEVGTQEESSIESDTESVREVMMTRKGQRRKLAEEERKRAIRRKRGNLRLRAIPTKRNQNDHKRERKTLWMIVKNIFYNKEKKTRG